MRQRRLLNALRNEGFDDTVSERAFMSEPEFEPSFDHDGINPHCGMKYCISSFVFDAKRRANTVFVGAIL